MRINGKILTPVHMAHSDVKQRWRERQKLLSESNPSESRDAELAAYDSKVHNALLEMQLHMNQQLGHLGVPFFGLDPRLVMDRSDGTDGSCISTIRLEELQRKMLDYLEAMYGP
jgi:hypothetical protein